MTRTIPVLALTLVAFAAAALLTTSPWSSTPASAGGGVTSLTTLTVTKNFNPVASFQTTIIGLNCTTGSVSPTDPVITSSGDTATFSILNFAPGATCSATENLTGNYETTGCQNVPISNAIAAGCTMTNTTVLTITWHVDFQPDSTDALLFEPQGCPRSITPVGQLQAFELPADDPAVFVWRGWTANSSSCGFGAGGAAGYRPVSSGSFCTSGVHPIAPTSYSNQDVDCTLAAAQNTTTLVVTKTEDNASDDVDATVSVSCPANITVTAVGGDNVATSDGGDPAEFTITNYGSDVPGTISSNGCTVSEAAIPGYRLVSNSCGGTTLVNDGTTNCTLANSNQFPFLVRKVWSPARANTSVSVTLSCNGTTSPAQPASTETPASFTVTATDNDPTCTATEVVPTGYFAGGGATNGTCSALLSAGECTITNTLRQVNLTTSTDFTDDSETHPLTWALSCNSGTKTAEDTTSTETTDAFATYTGVTPPFSCTRTAQPLVGYHLSGNFSCSGVIADDLAVYNSSCGPVIANANETKFTVDKDFIPDSSSQTVSIQLTCTGTTAQISTTSFGGAVDNTDDADEATDAEFYVRYAAPDDTCTATETTALPAHVIDQTQCANKAMTHGVDIACTITNTLNIVTLHVRKDWQPIDGRQVLIRLTCNEGATITALDVTAGQFDPADFIVEGGTSCTASETTPAGYTSNQTDCQAINPNTKDTCTIINRKGAGFPTFTPGTGPTGTPGPTPATPPPGTPRPTRTPRPNAGLTSFHPFSGLF